MRRELKKAKENIKKVLENEFEAVVLEAPPPALKNPITKDMNSNQYHKLNLLNKSKKKN